MRPSVAVVGAGMTGLSCARRLADAGCRVQVFDKGRGLGGRLATRRIDEALSFDHGVQFVTARGAGFAALLHELERRGVAARWRPRQAGPAAGASGWWVGRPGMSRLVRPLAEGLDVHVAARVVALEDTPGGWRLRAEAGALHGPFDRLVLALPPLQAAALLDGRGLAASLSAVDVAPCWAVLLAFSAPLPAPFDVWRAAEGRLAFAARNASKPGRLALPEAWVLHAGADWSAAHLEAAPEDVVAALSAAFAEIAGPLPESLHASAHRWRYARTLRPFGRPFLAAERLHVGGDWCLGAHVEAAYDSGTAIAEDLLEG